LSGSIIVLGLGEIGKPLLELIREQYAVVGVDIDPVDVRGEFDVMHICYPFEVADFVHRTVEYIEKYRPRLSVIHSTVAPGTTRAIHRASGAPIVHSPVRGKHIKMKQELLYYVKFIGGVREEWSHRAADHFHSIGMKTKVLSSPEATELAKLTETTYFAILIAWAQEVERYCDQLGLDYDEVASYCDEIGFLPQVRYFPGVIGGHCVMPNIQLLRAAFNSDILEAIEESNRLKILRDSPQVKAQSSTNIHLPRIPGINQP